MLGNRAKRDKAEPQTASKLARRKKPGIGTPRTDGDAQSLGTPWAITDIGGRITVGVDPAIGVAAGEVHPKIRSGPPPRAGGSIGAQIEMTAFFVQFLILR